MKKLLILVLAIFLSLSFTMPVNADRRGKQKRNSQGIYQKQERRDHYRSGYRYRHHGHRRYHPKHYRGHWRSWHQWERHRRHNHRNYQNGRYYRKNNSLYFEFENEDGRFIFSIGK